MTLLRSEASASAKFEQSSQPPRWTAARSRLSVLVLALGWALGVASPPSIAQWPGVCKIAFDASASELEPFEPFTTDPQHPTTQSNVTLLLRGLWTVGSYPRVGEAVMAGSEIRVPVEFAAFGPATMISWSSTFDLGPLDAGSYMLLVDAVAEADTSREADRAVCGPFTFSVIEPERVPTLCRLGFGALLAALAFTGARLVRR